MEFENKRYNVIISLNALAQLDEAIAYIVETLKNRSAALSLLSDFVDSIERIALFPYAMSRISNCRVTEKEYRKIIIRNFIAIYRINENAKLVEIMAFRYAPNSLNDTV